jgi:hypothetical protein
MYTPEDRFLSSLRNIIGDAEVEKTASETETEEVEVEEVEETQEAESAPTITKIADMSIDAILNDEHFLRGVSDRVGRRGYEIEGALHRIVQS